ncbi:5-formyltetrahydrofolate cyclo-ligase, partial [Lecanoromycetidae sp. Uapishka_2]
MPKGEVSTKGIVEDALQQGKQVFVPYLYQAQLREQSKPRSVMDMVSLHSKHDYQNLKSDTWGIPTPSEESIPYRHRVLESQSDEDKGNGEIISGKIVGKQALDVIVMPGMAFDRSFGRLGHGKGFYDYFLERYHDSKAGPMPFLVGLALDMQLLPEDQVIPTDASDWKLDALVVGDGTVLRKAVDS